MDHDQIFGWFERAGYELKSYSGRGMYGKRCASVYCERGYSPADVVLNVVREAMNDLDDGTYSSHETLRDLLDSLLESKTDSLGLGTVIYWRDLRWPDAEPDNRNDNEEADDE